MKVRTGGTGGRDARVGNCASRVEAEPGALGPRSLLVCFSGKIGAAARRRSAARWRAASDAGRTSFGGYLRDEVAQRGGDPDCRESLQDLGQSRIERDAESLCRDVLAAGGFVPGEEYVLDGIRHVDVLPHLVWIAAPSAVRLIFLDAEAGLRSSRVGERSAGAREDFDRAASHVVEADMEDGLPSAAHAIVDGSAPQRDVVDECVGLIDGWRRAHPCVASASESLGAAGGMQGR